jgi:hypothetical protein
MLARLALLLLVGCKIAQLEVRMGDPANLDAHDATSPLAMCTPGTRVKVTDSTGAPVAGALVVVRQREHALCPSMGPTTPLYTTEPVRTDSHGVATTCDPERFYRDESSLCRGHRDPATIVVVAGDQAAQLAAPFAEDVRVVLKPCAEVRAGDPEFPCAAK